MEELIRGAASFNQDSDHAHKSQLRELSSSVQAPHALLITCVDSRVMPSIITDADAGQILTLRNIGNLVPNCEDSGVGGDSSVASTVSFALELLNIENIIVMGHSECGGMTELYARRNDLRTDALGNWLRNGRRALQRLTTAELADQGLSEINRLSQLNVLSSLESLSRFPEVRSRLDRMSLTLHGWWFDLGTATVMAYEPRAGRFVPIEHAYESTVAESAKPPTWL